MNNFSILHFTQLIRTMSLLAAFRICARRSSWRIRVTCNLPLPVSNPSQHALETDKYGVNFNPRRHLSSMNPNDFIAASLIDSVTFETVCSETLESLCDYFEHLVEETSFLKSADITYGVGP